MIRQTFVFMPFEMNMDEYPNEDIMRKAGWKSDDDSSYKGIYQNHYLLKYVVNYMNTGEKGIRHCFHYIKAAEKHSYHCLGHEDSFSISEIHLYLFSTGVGIAAVHLIFDQVSIRCMADSLYQLKKAGDCCMIDENHSRQSMLSLVKLLTEGIQNNDNWNFFFYNADPIEYRCYLLSFAQNECEDQVKEDIYYLSHAYGYGFAGINNNSVNERTFSTAFNRFWQITSEGSACIAPFVSKEADEYTETRFYQNFNTHYLFMFILALHQKYVLYELLLSISEKMQNSLANLEEYQRKLYLFEKDFSFSVITEVPQYQIVYENLISVFRLEEIYKDVQDPLISLSTMQKEAQEKREKKRDAVINRALTALSILAIFSALVDSFDLLKEIFYGDSIEPVYQLSNIAMWTILFADIGIVLMVFIIKVLMPLKEEK